MSAKNMYLFILMVCLSVLMFLFPGCSQKIDAEWDVCRLYHGLEMTEIQLEVSQQNELADLISHYSLEETSADPIPTEEILYGGPYIKAEFVNNGATIEWSFNPNRFTKMVTENGVTETTCFEPDSALLNQLNEYCQ